KNVSKARSPSRRRARSRRSAGTVDGWPPTWRTARTSELSSWPPGTPAKRTRSPVASLDTANDGRRASPSPRTTEMASDRPATSSRNRLSRADSSPSSREATSSTGRLMREKWDRSWSARVASSTSASSDLADEVEGRRQGLVALVPLGRAHLAGVLADVLAGPDLAEELAGVPADALGGHLHGLDHTVGVDEEGGPVGQPLVVTEDPEVAGDPASGVAHHRVLDLLDGRRGVV